ncbi:MAG: hypothetical protein Kow0068_14880 [Marinilabiliales bacterium]
MRKFIIVFCVLLLKLTTHGQTFTSGNINSPIPDDQTEHCWTIPVSGVGTIDGSYGLEWVEIRINHTWDADLDIFLVAPDGTRVELTTDNGGSGNNYYTTVFTMTAGANVTTGSAPFNGSYVPEGDLGSVNNGQNADGNWQLCITDDSGWDSGTLVRWRIRFSSSPAPPPVLPDCIWQLSLSDTYGDGWNGGSISVYVGGVLQGTYSCSGTGPDVFNIPIFIGDDIFLDYTAGGWSYDNEYYLYDSYGNLVHSEGTGGLTPSDYTYSSADCNPHPVTPTEQDCLGAIPICGDSYSTTNSYSGTGNIPNEINGSNSCLLDGERNDVWYIFTVQQDGDLMFTISPNDPSDDYDWAVYNLTNANCSDIATDPTLEVSCNYSGTAGDTGPDGSTTYSSQGASGTPFNDAIPVHTGEVYVINVSNWSSTQNGYFIDFSMASGVIVDTTPPELDTIVNSPTCGQDQLTFWFTELVDTSSVNAGDFNVTGPGGPYSVTNIVGTGGSDMEREFILTLNTQLIAGGTYTLNFTGQVNDACGNTVIGNSLNFTVQGISGSVTVNDGSVICYDDAVGSATASATGGSGIYSYLWDTGSTNQTITNLPAGNYTVTISDDVGVCYDIVTATVNPANPLIPTGVWAGTVSSDWNNCENWGGGRIPTSSMDVIIPGGCPNYPVLSSNLIINSTTGICNSIHIQNGGSLTVTNNKNLTINNTVLRIDNGGTLFVDGDIIITSGGDLNQTGGTITLNGDFINYSSFTSTGGNVSFSGNVIQYIDGSQSSSFTNLTINNLNDVKLDNDISVKGNLILNTGNLNLMDFSVDLGTTGMLVNESSSSKLISLDGLGMPLNGTITAVRNNPSGNVAGLGLYITPSAPLGNTTITRGHTEQNGTGAYASNHSILRYYEIQSGAKSVTPCDLTFNYFDSELNGLTDGSLVMFQQIQQTWNGVPGPVYWSPLSTVNDGVANTAIATTIDNNLSTTLVTLASLSSPLPVELISFNAECSNEDIVLKWITASETNNDYFTIEKSTNGTDFIPIITISGKGNSNETKEYEYIDINNTYGIVYYRLSQTDINGKNEILSLININCSKENTDFNAEIIQNDNNYILYVSGCNDNPPYYYITDQLGKNLSGLLNINNDDITIIPIQKFKAGIYNIVVICNDKIATQKLIKSY